MGGSQFPSDIGRFVIGDSPLGLFPAPPVQQTELQVWPMPTLQVDELSGSQFVAPLFFVVGGSDAAAGVVGGMDG